LRGLERKKTAKNYQTKSQRWKRLRLEHLGDQVKTGQGRQAAEKTGSTSPETAARGESQKSEGILPMLKRKFSKRTIP